MVPYFISVLLEGSIIIIIITWVLGASGRVLLCAPASTACCIHQELILCLCLCLVIRWVSWWPAGMLVHYVTSHSMGNRSFFDAVYVRCGFTACVCNMEKPNRLMLRLASPPSSVIHVSLHQALVVTIQLNHQDLRLMGKIQVAPHLMKTPHRPSSPLWVHSLKQFDSMGTVPYSWFSP
jgi:hypothetical protein